MHVFRVASLEKRQRLQRSSKVNREHGWDSDRFRYRWQIRIGPCGCDAFPAWVEIRAWCTYTRVHQGLGSWELHRNTARVTVVVGRFDNIVA